MDTMKAYQERGVRELRAGRRGIFFKYGAGKTWVALQYANEIAPIPRIVVFCKKRNMITWRREIKKRLDIPILEITSSSIEDALKSYYTYVPPNSPLAVIVPYTLFSRATTPNFKHINDIFNVIDPTTIIADESTIIKNPKANVTNAMLALSKRMYEKCPLIVMSGNPKPERENEIWSQLAFTQGGLLRNQSYYQFLRKWFVRTDYGWVLSLDSAKEFYERLSGSAIWLTEQEERNLRLYDGMPTPQYILEHYQLRPLQVKFFEELFEEWSLSNEDGSDMDMNYVISIMMKAQQICSGFYYDEYGTALSVGEREENPKVALLCSVVTDLLEENHKRKIIIWRKFAAEDIIIAEALDSLGKGEDFFNVGPDEKHLTEFMDNSNNHVIVMPVDCSMGLNELVGADVDIYFSNDFSQEKRNQAEGRTERIDQKASVVTHIDLASNDQRDLEVITALQAKNLTPERLATIVRTRENA